MINLLALYLASQATTEIITPSYKVGNCYKIIEMEFRPGTIKITDIINGDYEYQVYFDEPKRWGGKLVNVFDTIERVYEKEVACP